MILFEVVLPLETFQFAFLPPFPDIWEFLGATLNPLNELIDYLISPTNDNLYPLDSGFKFGMEELWLKMKSN